MRRVHLLAAGTAIAVGLLAVPRVAVAQVATWLVETEPSLELGRGAGGVADEFGLVVAAARTSDGGIAVLDALQVAVKLFDARGRHLRDIGRRGDGPGEFRDPIALMVREDSLVVLDRVGRRTWLDTSGAVLATDRLSIGPLCDEDFNASYGGLLPDASLMIRCEERLFGRVSGEYRQSVRLLRVRRTGEVDSLGLFPADTGRADSAGVPVPRPYTPRSTLLWAAADDRVFVAAGDSPEIQGFSSSGAIGPSVDAPLSSRPVTPRDVAEEVSESLRITGNENDRRVVGEWLSDMPRRADTPFIRSIVASSGTEVWIESWDREGDRSWWLVANFSSPSFTRVLAPRRSRLLAAGPDWTLWLWRDDFDVEYLRVHRLRRD